MLSKCESRLGLVFALVFGVLAPAPTASLAAQQATATSSVSAPAQKLKVEGVPNLGQVTPTFLRGGQPTETGFRKLKEMGVEVVVNFRDEPDKIAAEKKQVEALGMRYLSIPWNASKGPDDRQVAEFLEWMRANPERKVFVHCHRGKERTGVMVAAYRIVMQNWTAPQALDEMEFFGIRGLWFGHLKQYIRELPKKLPSDPAFHALVTAPASP